MTVQRMTFIAVQEDIANRIAERLQVTGEQESTPSTTADMEAHKLYLQARQFWNKRTEDGLKKAIQYFKAAIDRTPVMRLPTQGWQPPIPFSRNYSPSAKHRDYSPLARASANRALELDPSCAEAHAVLGNLQFEARDYKGAEEHFRRAIQARSKLCHGASLVWAVFNAA